MSEGRLKAFKNKGRDLAVSVGVRYYSVAMALDLLHQIIFVCQEMKQRRSEVTVELRKVCWSLLV